MKRYLSRTLKPSALAAAMLATLSGSAVAQYVDPNTAGLVQAAPNGVTTYGAGITTTIMPASVVDAGNLPANNPGKAGGTGHYYGTLTQAQESDASGSSLLVSGEGATVISGWSDSGSRTATLVVNGNNATYGTTITGGMYVAPVTGSEKVNMGGNVINGVAAGVANTDAVNVSQLNAAIAGIPAPSVCVDDTSGGTVCNGVLTGATVQTTGGAATLNGGTVTAGKNGTAGAVNVTNAAGTNSITLNGTSGAISGASLSATGAISGATLATTGAATVGNALTVSTGGANVTGNSTITGTLGVSSDLAVNTNKFTVAGSSGNTSVGGTLGVTGATTLTGALTANGGATVSNGAALYSGAGTAGNSVVVNGTGTTVTGTTNAIVGTTTNINTAAGTASTVNVGNSNAATTVGIAAGNAAASLANNAASMAVAGGGSVSATNNRAVISAGNAAAGNVPTGNGGLTVYQTAQTATATGEGANLVAGNAASRAIVNGGTYYNRIQGNTLVDGNMYINGTLTYSSSNSATTTVTSGVSTLSAPTQSTMGQMAITNAGVNGATVNSASLTLTNGIGNTHGIQVFEDKTVLSGGTRSTTMTLNDNDITVANAQTGAPVQIKNVAEGTTTYDAVNFGQLKNLEQKMSRGIAATAAMTNIPHVDPDKTVSLGLGVGGFNGESAIAFGAGYRFQKNGVIKGSVATANSGKATYGVGAAWSW